MYEVVRYRNTKAVDVEEAMQLVFDHHSKPDKAGVVRGGHGKLYCLADKTLPWSLIETLVQTPCCAIIEEMRSLFHDLYLYIDGTDLPPDTQSRIRERRNRDPRVNVACEKLRTSDAILAIFEKHLGSDWGIDNDGSLDLTEPVKDPSASRNRLKRKADEIDSEENMHIARIGRMPPDSKQKVFDTYSSQTSGTSLSRNSLFSLTSKVPSSGLALSKSLGSRNNGPLAKR